MIQEQLIDKLKNVFIDAEKIEKKKYPQGNLAYRYGLVKSEIFTLIKQIENEGIQVPLPESIQWALNSGDGIYRP